eukprot:1136744-Pelagomonas_calceolata.AAC.2
MAARPWLFTLIFLCTLSHAFHKHQAYLRNAASASVADDSHWASGARNLDVRQQTSAKLAFISPACKNI